MRKTLLDQKGEIDMELRVVVNQRDHLSCGERMAAPLHDGDAFHLMTVT